MTPAVAAAARPPLPITFVTGWHGAGKSHLVDRLLAERPGELAVVHAGAAPRRGGDAWCVVGVEEELVSCSEDRCACCSIRLDLATVLVDLARRRDRPTHVLVELGGEADVAAALQTTLRDPDLRVGVVVDGVVTVVDVPATAPLVDSAGSLAAGPTLVDQICTADRIILGRSSLATDVAIDVLSWTLHFANPRAKVATGTESDSAGRTLAIGGFTPEGIVADRSPARATRPDEARTVARLVVDGTLDRDALSSWMDDLHHRQGADLLRLQGTLSVDGERCRWVARGVRTTLDLEDGPAWGEGEVRRSDLWVVTGPLDVEELRSGLAQCAIGAS